MKTKLLTSVAVLLLILTSVISFAEEESDELQSEITKEEITFRDIPWGTSFTDAEELMPESNFFAIYGESTKKYPVDDVLLGYGKGIDLEYNGINIIASITPQMEVAGYTTTDVDMYFAYTVTDGTLTLEKSDTALYGATYEFEAENLSEMSKDLEQKLTSLYGEPDSTETNEDWAGRKYTYIFWYGANDTELVMRTEDKSESTLESVYGDEIYISYAWRGGDELLQEASDSMKIIKEDQEAENYGSDNTSGL